MIALFLMTHRVIPPEIDSVIGAHTSDCLPHPIRDCMCEVTRKHAIVFLRHAHVIKKEREALVGKNKVVQQTNWHNVFFWEEMTRFPMLVGVGVTT